MVQLSFCNLNREFELFHLGTDDTTKKSPQTVNKSPWILQISKLTTVNNYFSIHTHGTVTEWN